MRHSLRVERKKPLVNREHAETYCQISSNLKTMTTRGYTPLVIQMALSGQIHGQGE